MDNYVVERESYSGDLLIMLFDDPIKASEVYYDLIERGYNKQDITMMMSEETKEIYFLEQDIPKTNLGNKSLEGMGVGSALGSTAGAIVAVVAALGTTLIIPSLGIVVAGAFAAALAGAGAGAITGGLVGALIGLGLPDKLAQEFETGIKEGGVVVGVYTKSIEDFKLLKEQWKQYRINNDSIFLE